MAAAFDGLLVSLLEDPGVALTFCGICMVLAWRFLYLSKLRLRQVDRGQNAQTSLEVAQMQTVVRLSDYKRRVS